MSMYDRDQLCSLIRNWNENRLDLFNISEPNEHLEFFGVMRFYFQEAGQKASTKCIRVSSAANTQTVIDALVEKFHPDFKMLTEPDFYIWEVHENGEERMLTEDERPLWVQLSWHQNNREGRFQLKSSDQHQYMPLSFQESTRSSKRSGKFKKNGRKTESSMALIAPDDMSSKFIYEELPETTFTRTISNPEVVMKKQREQKFEQKLKELEMLGVHGGSLKIYGEELDSTRPYISLLVSPYDNCEKVLSESVEKYGYGRLISQDFQLIEVRQVMGTDQKAERIVASEECPVQILARNYNDKVEISFCLRRKSKLRSEATRKNMPMFAAQSTDLNRQVTCFDVLSDAVVSVNPTRFLLPCRIQFRCSVVQFIPNVLHHSRHNEVEFPLGAAFVTFLGCKSSTGPELTTIISVFTKEVMKLVTLSADDYRTQIYWLANSTEFLFLLTSTFDISLLNQNELLSVINLCFDKLLDTCLKSIELEMSSFLELGYSTEQATNNLLRFMDAVAGLYRKLHANHDLCVQLFSHLFYYINMRTFNWLVSTQIGNSYLTREFGLRLRERLLELKKWSSFHGLEAVAEFQVDRINQTIHLLITPKNIDQIASLGATCYKLNSLQVKFLLERYIPEQNENPVTQELLDSVVQLAESYADPIALEEKGNVMFLEDAKLHQPLTIPTEGYFVESLETMPSQLLDILNELERRAFCEVNYNTNGFSQVYRPPSEMSTARLTSRTPSEIMTPRISKQELERVVIKIKRSHGAVLGLSIVAAQGLGDDSMGIYVKKVEPGSLAAQEGSLAKGDQLLNVNGMSLMNVSQEIAAQHIAKAGSFVQFEVIKSAALYNGLATLFELRTGVPPTPESVYSVSPSLRSYNNHGLSAFTPQPINGHKLPERFRPSVVKPVVVKPFSTLPPNPSPNPIIPQQLHFNDNGFVRRGSVGCLKAEADVNHSITTPDNGRRSVPLLDRPPPDSTPNDGDKVRQGSYLPLTNGTSRIMQRNVNPSDVCKTKEVCMNELSKALERRSLTDLRPVQLKKLYPNNVNKDDEFTRQVDLLQEQAKIPMFEEVNDQWNHNSHKENGDVDKDVWLQHHQPSTIHQSRASEVYNDPRQRRLNQLQENQTKKEAVNAEEWAFGDKMRLFASQLGENSPRIKVKTSSAEREINKLD